MWWRILIIASIGPYFILEYTFALVLSMSCFPRYWLKHLVHLQLRTNFTPCKFSATELSKDIVAASLHLHCCMGFDITEQRWEWSKILPRLIILCWTYFMMFPWFHRKLVRIVSGQSVSIHMCFNREDWYSQNSQLTYFFFSAGRLVVTLYADSYAGLDASITVHFRHRRQYFHDLLVLK